MATRCILILCLAVSDALIFFPRSYVRPPGIGGDVLPTAPKSRRSRSVQTMTYISMPKRLPSVSSGEIISFDLPGESAAAVQCIVEDVYEHSGGSSRTIHGRVSSLVHPEGDCLITCGIIDNERVSCLGNIRPDFMPHAQYELRPILNSTFHVLKEVLYSKYEDSDVDEEVQRGPRMSTKIREQHDAFAAKRLLTDTNQILDVMVVYTPDALTAIGSAEAVRLTVMLAIDESNKIFERSAIDLRLRLVHLTGMSNTAYADPSSLGTILTHATFYGGSNIAFDAEQSLRYTLQADALSVLTGESNSCGIAYMNGEGTADLQVSVTAYDCALGYYSFVHELGHNLGATHDLSSSSRGDGHFYYSHAYCWDRAESGSCDGTCRRSVLAYAACVTEKNLCSDCVRYPYISNPDVFEAGSATGVANLFDNAKTIRSTAAKASALQDSLQVGGMVFSVAPNVFDSTRAHFQVEIIGWYIGEGSDITKVWLAGVPVAEIVSQTRDRVTVIPGEAGGKDRFGDVVIYQSGLGINTTFQNGFTYRISNITYMIFEDFEGSVTTFVPAQELSFYYISASCTTGLHCINRGGFTADGVYAALEVDGTGRNGAFMAKFSNNGCFDTISAISVDYFAFSIHPQCYSPGFLTLQVKFEPSGQWVVVGSATSVQATASDEWRTLSTEPTFTPSVVYDVQVLISSYSSIDNCDWHNPVSLDNIKIVYTAECMPPAYVPSAAPSVSFTPIASPSLTPTIRPTYMTETIAFIPGSLIVYGVNISDFDQDYQHALAAAMMNSLNNNTRGGSSVEITGDAVEEAVRLAVMADRADSGIRVQYMISALVEQFGVGTEYIYSLVNSKLQRAANSAAIANIMNANLEYVKGSLFDRVTIGSMVNNENGVVIEIRKSTVPTVAPTTRTIKDIEKSNMDLTLIAAVGIGAIIALCCGGFLFYYCCIRSMGNKSKAIVSPDTEIAGARSS